MTSWAPDDITSLNVRGVSAVELDQIRKLLSIWRDRRSKNVKRSLYYDGEQAFKDLGIALPPQLKNAKFFLGWGTMAVRKPSMRSQFQRFRLPGVDDPFELSETLERNRFGLEFSQSVNDAGKLGVSFTTVAAGIDGEPDVQIQGHSAETSAATWDRRRRRIGSALTIADLKEDKPTRFLVWLPDKVLVCSKTSTGWVSEPIENKVGRVLVVPVAHDPQLRKPFGRSRITDPVMALTDMATRAYVRMEANAEFYSSPQIAILGADPDSFDGSESQKFKLAMQRLLALTKDADGDLPTLKQLQQATMTPHSDMLRTVAMAFSGETGIPVNSLGVIQDNPSSAEAIRAAEHDLLIDVTHQNRYVLGPAAVEIARLAVMVRDGLNEPPAESWKLTASFADPEFRSTSANADAYVKLAAANPDLANTDVLLETVFDADQIERIQAEHRKGRAESVLQQLTQGVADGPNPDAAAEAEGDQQ